LDDDSVEKLGVSLPTTPNLRSSKAWGLVPICLYSPLGPAVVNYRFNPCRPRGHWQLINSIGSIDRESGSLLGTTLIGVIQ